MIAVADAGGNAIHINRYDEYGYPTAANQGRFQYTGQTWLRELGVYNYKARMYSFSLGRFMQTDPIGYGDGLNWYAYVGGDPVNKVDPSGLGFLSTLIGSGALFGQLTSQLFRNVSVESLSYLSFNEALLDSIVVTAHKKRLFFDSSLSSEIKTRYNQGDQEWIIYILKDFRMQDAKAKIVRSPCSGSTTNAATVSPSGPLAAIAHGHQNQTSGGGSQYFSYPGKGDGFVPATRGITNYAVSSGDVFAVRPDASAGVGRIDHLVGSSSFPSSVEAELRSNAQAAVNSSSPIVCQK